jgi:hypothetical protein
MKIYLSELAEQESSRVKMDQRELYKQAFIEGFIAGTKVNHEEWAANVNSAPEEEKQSYREAWKGSPAADLIK